MALFPGAALLRSRLLKILSDEVLAEQHQSNGKAQAGGKAGARGGGRA